ncbi:MAG: hypothetical protein D6761_00795 [Candidatus Dadabacteria bacterium]|nr:MAG: hypothetical protein D6761_00795 [Candidatus Dadabacteria bacterium]
MRRRPESIQQRALVEREQEAVQHGLLGVAERSHIIVEVARDFPVRERGIFGQNRGREPGGGGGLSRGKFA